MAGLEPGAGQQAQAKQHRVVIIVLIALGAVALVFVLMLVGGAIAMPVFFSQRAAAQDEAAERDVRDLAVAIEVWYVDGGSGVPEVTSDGEYYYVDYGWEREVLPVSENVVFQSLTGSDWDDWCVWVKNPEGDLSVDGARYSAGGGFEYLPCW